MLKPSYTKEFKFTFPWKSILFAVLGGVTALCVMAATRAHFPLGEVLMVTGMCLAVLLFSFLLGYILGYKKIVFIYDNPQLQILFENGYGGTANKEFLINLDEVLEYKEKHIHQGSGYLQFILKNHKIVEIPYSSSLNMYIGMRREILQLLDERSIPKACKF